MDDQKSAPPSSESSKDLSKEWIDCINTPGQQNVREGSSSLKKHLVGESDRTREFPDDIKRKILSLLPTTDAASTGFTSRTWRTTWNSVPKLVFEYYHFPGTYSSIAEKQRTFLRFVNNALVCHDKSDVHIFEVWLWPSIDSSISINDWWITFAIEHNVKQLVLFGVLHGMIPDCLFSCQSIVKLELAIEGYFSWPDTFTLPNLRKLKLKHLVFRRAWQQDFFSCCPALEKLSLCFCDMTMVKTLDVTAPKLTEFMMCNCPAMETCSLSFQTNPLSKFIYISGKASKIEMVPVKQFGLVISAGRIWVWPNNDKAIVISSLIKITRELFKAKCLDVNSLLVQHLSLAHDLPRQLAVDVSCNISKLVIGIKLDAADVRTAMLLISRCVSLSRLGLVLEPPPTSETVDLLDLYQDLRNLVTGRSFGEIEDVRIKHFRESGIEFTIVRFLLAHTPKLDVLVVHPRKCMIKEWDRMRIEYSLYRYKRACPTAKVQIS